MAKKIVSILCALAMLATMVTVGMVSAFAGEGDTGSATVPATGSQTIDLLDTEHLANWGITRQFTDGRNYAGKVDFTQDSSLPALEGITGALVHEKPNVWSNQSEVTSGYVRFDYNQPMNFGSDFSILMTDFIQGNVTSTKAVADTYVGLTLGDYSVRLVRFQQDATAGTSGKYAFRIALYVKNELYACSNVLSTTTTTSLYDGAVYSHDYGTGGTGSTGPWYPATNYKGEMTGATGEFSTYILQQCLGANDKPSTVAVMFGSDAAWKDIKIVFKDGNLQVLTANDTVCNFAIVSKNPDVDVTTLTEFNTPSLNLSDMGVTSFNGVTPSVTLQNDKGAMNSAPTGMFRLKVTVNTMATNTQEINFLDSSNIGNWDVNRELDYSYAGALNLSEFNLEGIDGALSLVRTNATNNSQASVDFEYKNPIDFGSDFSMLMTAFIYTNIGPTSTVTDNAYISLALGNYSVRLVRFKEDVDSTSKKWNRCEFRVALYGPNDTLLAVTNKIDSETTTDLYSGKPYSSNLEYFQAESAKNGTEVGTVTKYLVDNSTKSDGTSHLTSYTGTAYGKDSGWRDITVTVKDGKLSVSLANNKVCSFAVIDKNFNDDVTSLDTFDTKAFELSQLGITSFDGITPVVRCCNDGVVMSGKPSAVFRLKATINSEPYESDTRLKPYAANTTVDSALSSNMLFTPEQVTAWETQGYTDVTVIAKVNGVAKQTISKFDDMYAQDKTGTVKLYKAAKFNFLTPDLYGTTVEYVVSATKGNTTSTYTKQYSIKDYCVNQMKDCHDFLALTDDEALEALKSAGISEPTTEMVSAYKEKATKLGNLCMSILDYAESVRAWAVGAGKSNVETSITDDLADDYKTAFVPTSWDSSGLAKGSTYGDNDKTAVWKHVSLNFRDEIGLNFDFTLTDGIALADCALYRDSTKVVDGEAFIASPMNEKWNRAVARISPTAFEIQYVYVVANPDNDNELSTRYSISVQDWVLHYIGLSTTNNLEEDCLTKMMTYGKAAQAYVG